MDNSIALETNDSGMSRKKFLTTWGVAAVAGGMLAEKSQDLGATTGIVAAAAEGAYLSMSFTGTLDALGKAVFAHGLGAMLPANILSVSAFIRLPDGKVRNISVEHVDDTSISIAAGVPNASVKVGVVYSKDGASW